MGGVIHLTDNRNKMPWLYTWKLRKLAIKENFDIVHIHGNSATMEFELLAFKGLKAKRIVHVHGVNTQHPVVHKLLYPLFKNSYDVAFAASNQAGQWLIKNHQYTVINNGIDVNRFLFNEEKRIHVRKSLGIDDDSPVIMHVGAFSEQKNHVFLLHVFNQVHLNLPNAKLILIGKGNDIGRIKEYCKKNRLNNSVKFLGELNNTEDYYSAADLFLFPSKFEPFGIVTLEAQCAGLSVIASNVLPTSVNVTSNVSFLPLSAGYGKWANEVIAKIKSNENNRLNENLSEMFSQKGYSISENAKKMRLIYFKLVRSK